MKSFCALAAVLVPLSGANFFAWSQIQKQIPANRGSTPVSMQGKQTFSSACASCHGLDGRGGGRAPNIVERPRVQQLSDAQISHIIENGIPGTGMPAFHSLQSSTIQAVVTYLRSLQGANKPVKLPGDPERGAAMFLGKAGCSACHMVAGHGGFIASDLSGYARSHDAEQIRNAITTPAPAGDHQGRMATATVRGGEKYAGRIRNQDNFSVQLQALDGTFHFIAKSDLEGLEYSSQTLMPSNYNSTLTSNEVDDLVSYLMKAANVSNRASEAPQKEFEEE